MIKNRFKPEQNHPDFKKDRDQNCIVEHNGIYYNTRKGSETKKKIMEEIKL